MSALFNTYVYLPLYNALVVILSQISWIDVGMAVIILTVLVKLLLFPLSLKSARHQQLMKKLEEPMREIKEKYKDNKEEQGRKMLELYKKIGANPLSGIFLMLIQLPVIIGLYFVFYKGGLPDIHTESLYGWVAAPENVRMTLLGIVDMAGKSLLLAVIAGITQFIRASYSMPTPAARKENASFQDDFARSMQMNVKYVFPFLIATFAYILNAAVALYWVTSNIFAILQEIYVKRQMSHTEAPVTNK